MNNQPGDLEEDDIPETDFTGGVRGKYYERATAGTNIVLLEPDVAKVFRDSAVVSQALREISIRARSFPEHFQTESGLTLNV
jgi:hypothetical protein